MKKAYRILKTKEFSRIIYKKKSKASKAFVLYYDNRALDHARIGISVSKKLGNAVIRNKIKRQIREMLKDDDLDNLKLDFIVIARNGYFDNDFLHNKEDLHRLMELAKIKH